jgi:cytochrome c peroxidase
MPGGNGQQLNLNATEVNAVIAFLRTLSGTDVYVNTKWSNPFN